MSVPTKFKITLKVTNLADIYLSSIHRTQWTRIVCNPRPAHFIRAATKGELNRWSGFLYDREEVKEFTDWKKLIPFLNHINYTWCDNESQFKNVLNRWAFLFQYPHIKQNVAMLTGGVQGSGKSMAYVEVIGKLIGRAHYQHITDMEDVTGNFTACLANKLLVFVDEAKATKDHDLNLLKNLITGETHRSRALFKDSVYDDSLLFFAMCSNHIENMIKMDAGERRYEAYYSFLRALLEHPFWKSKVTPEISAAPLYFEVLLAQTREEATLKTILNFFLHYPISKDFIHSTPHPSKLLSTMKMQSISWVSKWWAKHICEAAEDKHGNMDSTLFLTGKKPVENIYANFKTYCEDSNVLKQNIMLQAEFNNNFNLLITGTGIKVVYSKNLNSVIDFGSTTAKSVQELAIGWRNTFLQQNPALTDNLNDSRSMEQVKFDRIKEIENLEIYNTEYWNFLPKHIRLEDNSINKPREIYQLEQRCLKTRDRYIKDLIDFEDNKQNQSGNVVRVAGRKIAKMF